TLTTLPFFHAAPAWFERLCDGTSTGRIFVGELALTAWALFAPAMLMGLSLPLLVAGIVREPGSYGDKLGRLYAVNTLGCALGAFLTGFVLIPRLGIHATVGVIPGATLSVGVIAWERAAALTYRLRVLGNAVVLCAGVVAWLSLPAGPFLKSSLFAPRKLLFYAEGNNATVSVLQEGDGTKSISVDGQPVAGTVGTSVIDQKMLAHLPLLLHHAPHRALTVGFGSGGTSYSMSLHGVAVDCVELEACVPAAAHLFESENHGVFAYPNFRLIVDDARSYLHLAPADYDVIVTDCTNIQYRSNGDLYTVDYFRLMRDRLTPQGIAAAWVPANGIAESDLKILLRSFRQVFPHTTIWYMNTLATDFVIVTGTPTRLEVDLDALGTRMASSDVARDLSEVGLSDPFRLLYTLLVGEDEIEAYLAGGAVNTDDKPVLSYSTYGASFQSTIAGNLSKLLAYRKEVSRYASPSGAGSSHLRHFAASNELILGHIAHLAGADSAALPHYQRAAQLLPDDLAVQALAQPIYRRGYSTASERAD
ncbi:MAG TPA: fused MFS/spermidine synthase, partial [Gemmataceae bacterium]|nr:fused MFS/spermidine synthase [Gemmataceae bacterium]